MQRRLAMLESRECGAKTRKGARCRSPAMRNGRCRMHGGKSTGAPKGNKNAWKHGHYSEVAKAERSFVKQLLKDARKLLSKRETDVRDLYIEGLWLGLSLGLAGASSETAQKAQVRGPAFVVSQRPRARHECIPTGTGAVSPRGNQSAPLCAESDRAALGRASPCRKYIWALIAPANVKACRSGGRP
jgi:hypothetical protein